VEAQATGATGELIKAGELMLERELRDISLWTCCRVFAVCPAFTAIDCRFITSLGKGHGKYATHHVTLTTIDRVAEVKAMEERHVSVAICLD
jgi:hypothetical protein